MARRRGLSVAALRLRIEKRARWRCEYCHAPQKVSGYRFHLEHILPRAVGGPDAFGNRALACATCNLAKADKTLGIDPRTHEIIDLFNPREQAWDEHFRWSKNRQTIIGKTPTGGPRWPPLP